MYQPHFFHTPVCFMGTNSSICRSDQLDCSDQLIRCINKSNKKSSKALFPLYNSEEIQAGKTGSITDSVLTRCASCSVNLSQIKLGVCA